MAENTNWGNLPQLLADLAIIQKLDDEPNDVGGLTAAELKAKFDEAAQTIQSYLNSTLLPAVQEAGEAAEGDAGEAAEELETALNAHTGDNVRHITAAERALWNKGLFWCVYGTTTFAEITAAKNVGKLPVCARYGAYYVYDTTIISLESETWHRFFGSVTQNEEGVFSGRTLLCSDANVWSQSGFSFDPADSRNVNKPVAPLDPDGTSGQFLISRGDGRTEWADFSEEALVKVLEDHKEWVTTVENGSLTEAKFSDALKVKAVKKYITPDMFAGATDAAKLQAAIDYSIANGLPSIGLERVYDLTGDTIEINKGIRVTDDVSAYSRNKLDFIGFGEAKLRKTDAGVMFSASFLSGDITFTNVKFQGDSTSNSPVDCIDMRVFDCAKLIRLTLINCTFTWCGRVYYQNDTPANTAQSIVSIGNLYAKNNIVAELFNLFDGRFIGDTIEDGVQFFKSWGGNSITRALRVADCCIEGMSDKSIQIRVANSVNIVNNYFEANRGHISIPIIFNGSITGNIFFGRGNLPSSEEISCMEICVSNTYDITGNYCIEANEHTTFIKINTESPYYNTKRKIFGGNYAESPTVLTNVPDDVIDAIEISRNLSTYAESSTQDLTASIKNTYSQITGGTIKFIKMNGFNTINLENLVISSPITSGSYAADAALFKPTDGGTHCAAIGDNGTGKVGTMFLNYQGTFGLRIPNAGTYNGQIVWR